MEKLLSLGVVCLFIGMTVMTLSRSQDGSGTEGIQDRFVGAWRLASLEGEGADRKIHRSDSTGLLVFTRDAHMSVEVMERNPQTQTPAGLSSIRRAATRPPLAHMKSTNAPTPLLSTSREHWCGSLSAKTCRVHSSSRVTSSL